MQASLLCLLLAGLTLRYIAAEVWAASVCYRVAAFLCISSAVHCHAAGDDLTVAAASWRCVAIELAVCLWTETEYAVLLLQLQARQGGDAKGGKRKKGDDGGAGAKRQRTAKRPYD